MASVKKIMRDTNTDIVVVDADDEPVVLVEVHARRSLDPETYPEIVDILRERAETFVVPYFILADLTTVRIFRRGATTPELELPTDAVRLRYEAGFAERRDRVISPRYLRHLIEAWLTDVEGPWKVDNVPYEAELEKVGLTQRIALGSTISRTTYAA